MTAPLIPAQIAAWRATHTLSAHAREIADSHDRLTETLARVRSHHAADECDDCGTEFCVGNEPLHFHHDGCPWEYAVERERDAARAEVAKLRAGIRSAMQNVDQGDARSILEQTLVDGPDREWRVTYWAERDAAALATPGSSAGGNNA